MKIILKKLLAIIILLIVGIALLIISLQGGRDGIGEKLELLFGGILGVGFSVFAGITMFFSYIKNPKSFILNQTKEYQRNKKTKAVKFVNESVQKERNIFFFIFKNPLIWSLYLVTFVIIGVFFYSEFVLKNFLVIEFLKYFNFQNSTLSFVASAFFLYSFIILSILLLPFFILAEIYQKRIKGSSSNILYQIMIDFIYATPYLIIWSFLWMIFILTAKKRENRIDTITSFSILAIISAFSYWTYYSLAKIGYDDKRKLFPAKDPISFYNEKGKQILAIWVHSGFYFAIPFGIYILVFSINTILGSLSLVSEETIKILFEYFTIYLGMPSLIFGVLGSIMSSQLNLLNYSIKESENISEDFVLDLE